MVHLPVPDEYTSFMRHIAKHTSILSDEEVQHQHPLTLHHDYVVYNDDDNDNDDDDVHHLPTCNACVQFISRPFYTCSQCPKLCLHDCSARLPLLGRYNPGSWMLVLEDRQTSFDSFVVISQTTCCDRVLTNDFVYAYSRARMDVMCSMMPDLITHAAHTMIHMLCSTYASIHVVCRCCNKLIERGVPYNCTTCRNLSIHATCARLPATVNHLYDPHPLKLVAAPSHHMYCLGTRYSHRK